jgi:hypothetical protein
MLLNALQQNPFYVEKEMTVLYSAGQQALHR